VAAAKAALSWDVALLRGVLCNVLVCLAVWMAAAGRSVVDKAVAALVEHGAVAGLPAPAGWCSRPCPARQPCWPTSAR